jgi:adenylate cyclase
LSEPTTTRRLATIVCADVAGYSRLMGQDEEATLAAFKAHRREVVDPAIARHRGRIVNTAGDGLLAEFASVADAVACTIAVQSEMARRNAALEPAAQMHFRFGINLADVIVDGEQVYGDGVNVAARLETLAEPGGACLSAAVYEQVRGRRDAGFVDIGAQVMKNIEAPVHVYRLRLDGAAGPAAVAAAPPEPEAARGTIAVLPFDSLSPHPDDSYLADGIASEIIGMLSRVPDLRVTSRRAAFALRDRVRDLRTVARAMGLHYVLTGSVRRAGDRLRVIAELSDAAEGTQIWSHTYVRRFEDLFAVQEELAEAIVIAFGGEYLRAEWRRAGRRSTDNLDAWGLVQKAKALHLVDDRAAIAEALELAQRAVALDPAYGGAHARLGSILMQRVISGFSEDAAADRARALAAVEHAARLASDDVTVLRTLGNVWSNLGEHAKAVRALRRAVALAPFDFHTWGRLARTLAYGGDAAELTEGLAILDRILGSAPNHPMVAYWLSFKANALTREARYEGAVQVARQSVEARPAYSGAWVTLANALGQLGRSDEARDAMDRALAANPSMTARHYAQQVEFVAGHDRTRIERSLGGLRTAGLL